MARTFGASFEETIQRAVFFEMTCEIMLRAGDALSPLNPLDSDALLELSRKSKAV
jgi:hypothetical protein